MKYISFFIVCIINLTLLSCSSIPESELSDKRDKFETTNRSIYKFNMKVDDYILEPVARQYKKNLPKNFQKSISNHVEWAGLPKTTLNSALQGKFENATLASLNFLVNGLTLGFANLTEDDEKIYKKDFDQTLAFYNVPDGNYLMLPLLGSSTYRSTAGRVVDWVTNPLSFLEGKNIETINEAQLPLKAVSFRSDKFALINDLKYNSLDPYSRIRSAYYQKRNAEINYGKGKDESVDEKSFESFFDD